jgi:hypothetical protein
LPAFFPFTPLTSFFSVSLFLELDSLLIPSTLAHLQEEFYVYIRKCLLISFFTSNSLFLCHSLNSTELGGAAVTD